MCSTWLNFTVYFGVEDLFSWKKKQVQSTQRATQSWKFLILLLAVCSFTAILYRFFFVSTPIKMWWRKSQWSIRQFIFFILTIYILVVQHASIAIEASYRFSQKKQHASKKANKCSYWRLYNKNDETKTEQSIFLFSFLFSI